MTWGCAACCALLAVAASPATASAPDPTRPYVVVYDTPPGAAFPVQAETAARERRYKFESNRRFRHVIDGFAARLTGAEVQALRADPEVALVAPDRRLRASRVALSSGEDPPTGVRRIGAVGPGGVHAPSSAAVAVLDTGIDFGHSDLVARAGANCIGSGPPEDDNGHGTFVAGVIGARNQGAGVVGVAPGTELYAVKVLGAGGSGLVSEVICGIDWVTANAARLGIRVANMSLSERTQSEVLHMAIQRAVGNGTVYTVAAGNSGLNLALEIPGTYPEVLTVTAMSDSDGDGGGAGPPMCLSDEIDDSFWTLSNYATRAVDIAHVIAAPGVCITSTASGGGYETGTGTSAAAPHVAGVVAVCMGEAGRPGPCADMTPAEVIEQVRSDAAANASPQNGFVGDPFLPVSGYYYGHLVSGVDPTVRRIPQRQPAPVAAAAPAPRPSVLDTKLELLAMRISSRQDVDTLSVVVRLAEAGTVSARARVQVPGGAARVILSRPASARAKANQTRRLRLRLRRAALRQVKRVLRRGVRVRANVKVTVSDLAGNARSKTVRVRLTP